MKYYLARIIIHYSICVLQLATIYASYEGLYNVTLLEALEKGILPRKTRNSFLGSLVVLGVEGSYIFTYVFIFYKLDSAHEKETVSEEKMAVYLNIIKIISKVTMFFWTFSCFC